MQNSYAALLQAPLQCRQRKVNNTPFPIQQSCYQRCWGAFSSQVMHTAGQAAKKMVLVVAVALVDQQQRVLLAQRPEGKAMAGLWEFPGGKVNADTREQAVQPCHSTHYSSPAHASQGERGGGGGDKIRSSFCVAACRLMPVRPQKQHCAGSWMKS